jgi:hypothetical protein
LRCGIGVVDGAEGVGNESLDVVGRGVQRGEADDDQEEQSGAGGGPQELVEEVASLSHRGGEMCVAIKRSRSVVEDKEKKEREQSRQISPSHDNAKVLLYE